MNAFETLTGFAEQGPHRGYADYLLFPMPLCHRCEGHGCVGHKFAAFTCGPCAGGGRAFRPDSPEIAAIVAQVLEFFPDATKKPSSPTYNAPVKVPAPAAAAVVAPNPLPTCFVAVTAPRLPHPLVRVWSGLKTGGAKALDLLGTALCVFQVVTFSWATALLMISREFVWVPVVAVIGVGFTWLAIEHAGLVALKWGTISRGLRRRGDDHESDDDEEDIYPRRRVA